MDRKFCSIGCVFTGALMIASTGFGEAPSNPQPGEILTLRAVSGDLVDVEEREVLNALTARHRENDLEVEEIRVVAGGIVLVQPKLRYRGIIYPFATCPDGRCEDDRGEPRYPICRVFGYPHYVRAAPERQYPYIASALIDKYGNFSGIGNSSFTAAEVYCAR